MSLWRNRHQPKLINELGEFEQNKTTKLNLISNFSSVVP